MIHVLKQLACWLVGTEYAPGMDVHRIDDVPKKRLQSMLRAQLTIEYLVKLVEHCWRAFFAKSAERVRATKVRANPNPNPNPKP